MKKTISQEAQQVIEQFETLHIGDKTVRCPYFNNRRSGVRAGLRVLIGKGSPKEIEEESVLIALREKKNLSQMSAEEIRAWLIDHNIGIDCSGFLYYVLSAEAKKNNIMLKKALSFPFAKNPIRRIIAKLRAIENAGVKTLVHQKNAQEITLSEIAPGDMIYMLSGKQAGNPDHVVLVASVTYDQEAPKEISYVHSLKWNKDGDSEHGIRHGTITVKDPNASLEAQEWTESGISGKENETFSRYIDAETSGIARLHALS